MVSLSEKKWIFMKKSGKKIFDRKFGKLYHFSLYFEPSKGFPRENNVHQRRRSKTRRSPIRA